MTYDHMRMRYNTIVRNLPWPTKVDWAKRHNVWDDMHDRASRYLDETTPAGFGIGSSDVNHVAMSYVEAAMTHWLQFGHIPEEVE